MKAIHISQLLRWADRILTACFVLAFFLVSALSLKASPLHFGRLIVFSAIAFLLVTLLRHFFAKKRPYQSKDGIAPRRGENDSFPSRHAFSAFFIAMLAFSVKPLFGYSLLPFAILLSAVRVFRGIHYPIDVVAGGFLGVLSGTVCLVLI